MSSTRARFCQLVALAGLLVVLLPPAGVRAQTAPAASEAAGEEQDLFRLINQARAQAGVPELKWNEWLAQAARQHARQMVRRRQLAHEFPGEPDLRQRLAATSLRFNASAENVALGPNAAEIQESWMQSSGHRANILNPKYNAIGIAVLRVGETFYAVADFAHRVPKLSSPEIEDQVAAALNQLRAQEHMAPLRRRQVPELRRFACEMARQDSLRASDLVGRAGMIAALAFTDSDPSSFVSQLLDVRNASGYRAFAVGACFARSSTYIEGTNWIVVGFF